MPPPTRLVMLGTGDFAVPTFEHLLATGHRVVGLITQPDRPQGRKQELIPSRIKRVAQAAGVPVAQPEDVNASDGLEIVKSFGPDLLVTAAYGQILSAELLGLPPLGGINLHGSILPSYRGAAPVARAIEHGEVETGVTVIRMTPRIDAGGMIAVGRTLIDPDETAGELEERLARLGAPLLAEALAAIVAGTASVLPQDRAQVTRAPKLHKEEGRIDWSKSARAVHDLVRAMQPWPTASTAWHSREVGKAALRLIAHKTGTVEGQGTPGSVIEASGDRLVVGTGAGLVRILIVQVAGKKAMNAADFLRGHRVLPGDRMGEPPA